MDIISLSPTRTPSLGDSNFRRICGWTNLYDMKYDFMSAEEKIHEKPKKFKMERNLIPKKIAAYLQAGGKFYQ